jgi:hypothetical protein
MLSFRGFSGGTVSAADETHDLVMNAHELCDARSCNAQARVRVYLKSLNYIQFCKHHADAQPDSLFAGAEYVLNESKYILQNP